MLSSIQKAKSGDLLAFGDLYDASYERVYRFIFYRTLDTETTEDIISDVYTKAMKSITRFRGESEGEWYSWILQIAYTTFVDSTRHIQYTESLDDIEWEPGYRPDNAGDIDNRDKLAEVLSYMDTLSLRDKNIVMMRIWDDMSYEDISRITGESVSNSKKIVSRTLEKIAANISVSAFILLILPHVFTK